MLQAQQIYEGQMHTTDVPYGLSPDDSLKDKLIKVVAIARDEGIQVDVQEFGGEFAGIFFIKNGVPHICLERYPKYYRQTIKAMALFLKIH